MLHLLEKIRRIFRPSPSCQEVNRFLAEYIEGVLPAETQARFKMHLDQCAKCKPYFEQYLMTLELVKEDEEVNPPEELLEHTIEFLRAHLNLKNGEDRNDA